MAKDLPYFKFFCSEWADGDVTLEDFDTQGLFINICAYYWSNECVVEHSKLLKKFKGYDLSISNLIHSNIIKLKENYISISFLDEQLEEREKVSKQNSKNIKDYWDKKRALNDRTTNVSIPLNESDSIKIREDEKRKEKKRKEKIFTPPLISDVVLFFKENDFTEVYATKVFNYYNDADWKDANGKQVLNWKQKMRGVWFKDEYKINSSTEIFKCEFKNHLGKIYKKMTETEIVEFTKSGVFTLCSKEKL